MMLIAISLVVPCEQLWAQAGEDHVIRPHLAKQMRYEGLISAKAVDLDKVDLLEKWPKKLAPMGRGKVIIADSREPNSESAEFLLKKAAVQIGANIVKITKRKDVTKNFRSIKTEKKRGVSALDEFEVAAIIAKANLGGGQLFIGQLNFFVTATDRYGDSDVSGAFHLTLSHSDTREWSVGHVGPRYQVVRLKKRLSQVTGPSGKKYDVRIVGRRAKVYPAGLKTELTRKGLQAKEQKKHCAPQLYYSEFSLIFGLRESTGMDSP